MAGKDRVSDWIAIYSDYKNVNSKCYMQFMSGFYERFIANAQENAAISEGIEQGMLIMLLQSKQE